MLLASLLLYLLSQYQFEVKLKRIQWLFSKILYLAQLSVGDKIANDIQAHAGSKSIGQCAKFVRQCIERVTGAFSEFCIYISLIYKFAGKDLQRTEHAKNYGPSLQAAGFKPISKGTPLLPGDIRIIQPVAGHPSGHMQVYTNNGWFSDFKQRDQWPGPAYRQQKPSFSTYRYEGWLNFAVIYHNFKPRKNIICSFFFIYVIKAKNIFLTF